MYRSASTLQFQIASQLIKDADVGKQVGWIDVNHFFEVRDLHASCSGLKVVKVHRCTDSIISEFMQNNAMGIYSFRDSRDVYASMMQQQQKPFDAIWNWHGRDFIKTSFDNHKNWTSLPRVLVSQYEDIVEDIPKEVKRIASHLDIEINFTECQQIAANFSITQQQERVKQFKEKLLQMPRNPNDHREIVDYHDEDNLLQMNHIDSAKVGRWKEDLSAKEVAMIENKVKNWCVENGYEHSISLRQT